MLTLSAGRMAQIVGGELVSGSEDIMVNGVSTDSRDIAPGCVFIAMPGERSDGNVFVAEALRSGARAALVTKWDDRAPGSVDDARHREVAIIRVRDAGESLRSLARYHRSRLSCPVVGITGSTGKTTTKDFLAAVLRTRMRVVATEGNRNNEIGVPLTVLQAGTETDVLVVEMGMRGEGEIAALCDIARPTLGLVTNIGQTHMETLGSQEAILHAKGELVCCIPETGRVFLNGDDGWSRKLANTSAAPVTFYGLARGSSVRAEDIAVGDDGRPSMTIVSGRHRAPVTLPVPGRHNAYNAAAAAAVALSMGISMADVVAGLAAAPLTEWRMQVFTAANGVTVVNDAYNANPSSMRAALTALAEMRSDGRRIAVLGDMGELGSLADLAHFRVGEQVAEEGIDLLVTVGVLARRMGEGARAAGLAAEVVRQCGSVEEASEVLDDVLAPGDLVLVKASRFVGLERVVEGIVQPRA